MSRGKGPDTLVSGFLVRDRGLPGPVQIADNHQNLKENNNTSNYCFFQKKNQGLFKEQWGMGGRDKRFTPKS
jgi:hypothetical protein